MPVKIKLPSNITLTKAAKLKILAYDAATKQFTGLIADAIDVKLEVLEGTAEEIQAVIGAAAMLSVDGIITMKQVSTGVARPTSSGCSTHIRSSHRPYIHTEGSKG